MVAVCAQTSYRNPVINTDVPDISVCKVADTYYMISTTMHLMPGGPVMKSKDMINWEVISYVFDRIDDGNRYNLLGGQTVYGQGQWASSIRYHMGRFWVWFTANGAPGKGFVFCADKAEGPWRLVARPPHMHDASLFFDEDGKKYLFTGSGSCTVVELDDNFCPKAGGMNRMVVNGVEDPDEKDALLEGSSVVKHNGYYYICMISMKWGEKSRVRREVCYRSRSIGGPYEKKIILETPFETYGGVGQGCLVGDTESNSGWWAFIFQDRGGIGRVPCAMPVTWVDDWPMCGEYTGEINTAIAGIRSDNPTDNPLLDRRRYRIPNDTTLRHPLPVGICGSDDFASSALSLYWQWNHNPIDSAWSLTEKPGCLRLHTARVVDNLYLAPNTLTQRMSGPTCTGSVCIDVSHMKDSDVAGFAAFNGDSGVLSVVRKGKCMLLVMSEQKSVFNKQTRGIERVDVSELASVPLQQHRIYLRIAGDFRPGQDFATFFYSTDGRQWTAIGRPVKMVFDCTRCFMGSKFAIFNYATKATGGYVDVEHFDYAYE